MFPAKAENLLQRLEDYRISDFKQICNLVGVEEFPLIWDFVGINVC